MTNQEIIHLANDIARLNELYRQGRPEVTDSEYDQRVAQLKEVCPDHPWFSRPEPVKVSEGRKSKLPLPMKSLDKAKNIDEVMGWCKSVGLKQQSEVVVMPKFDGLSLLVDEQTGQAWSRGGSENEGQDCSPHLKANESPLCPEWFKYTYGEFCFSTEQWEKQFAGKIAADTGLKYKSPRNTAAGMLNRDVPPETIKHVSYYRYGTDPESLSQFECFSDLLCRLSDVYGQQYMFATLEVSSLTDENLMALFKVWRAKYYIDGLVIYVNDVKTWGKIGRHETSGNPLYAIAYKHPDFTDTFETTVLGVEFNANKSGALKPVVKIDEVDTGDCVMDSPTGYNMRWLAERDIAEGAVVLVTRSGGVIPKILSVLEPASYRSNCALMNQISKCPHCGMPTKWNDSKVDIVCTNPRCKGINIARTVFFFTTVGAENIGEETYRKFIAAGFYSIKKILDMTFDDIVKIDGLGASVANFAIRNAQKIKEGVEATLLMQASSCFTGIGPVKAEKILSQLTPEDLDAFVECRMELGEAEWRLIRQMSVTNQEFYNNMQSFFDFVQNNGLKMLKPVVRKTKANGQHKGEIYCFSGFRSEDIEAELIDEGATVTETVSTKTTALIVRSLSSSSSKITRAKKLGVPIIVKEDFKVKHSPFD